MRTDPRPEFYVDASLFLGMNSAAEDVRIACKGFFVRHLRGRVAMSLEQVGRCDDLVWGYSRALQDAYYPFMDTLHTVMDIRRTGYDDADIGRALTAPLPPALPVHERLMLGMVLNRDGVLHTASPRLRSRAGLPVHPRPATPEPGPEPVFPEPLEGLYRRSLALRLPVDAL
jgi:Family of unknown function (DUF6190)